MATIEEVRQKLSAMSETDFQAFRTSFGGTQETREQYVQTFIHKPDLERLYCDKLGLATEADKQTMAFVQSASSAADSAKAATRSANAARVSAICSIIAITVSLAALIISLFAYLFPAK